MGVPPGSAGPWLAVPNGLSPPWAALSRAGPGLSGQLKHATEKHDPLGKSYTVSVLDDFGNYLSASLL